MVKQVVSTKTACTEQVVHYGKIVYLDYNVGLWFLFELFLNKENVTVPEFT